MRASDGLRTVLPVFAISLHSASAVWHIHVNVLAYPHKKQGNLHGMQPTLAGVSSSET